MSGLSTKRVGAVSPKLRSQRKTAGDEGGPREFLNIHLLNRIKLNGDVFSVYSKVDILYYSQNGKIEGRHSKNAILLSETRQRQSALLYAVSASTKWRSVASIRRTATSERKRQVQ
jgi:hypothetical protein